MTENKDDRPVTHEDIKDILEAFSRVTDELKKERMQSEQEPVTQTLNG